MRIGMVAGMFAVMTMAAATPVWAQTMAAQAAVMQVRALQMDAQASQTKVRMMQVGDPQVKDELFEGTEKFAKGASDVTDVNLDPNMLGMVSGKHGGGELAHKMNFMVVRSYTYPHRGMYSMEDVEAYRKKLKMGWNCFIHSYESESGESTDICNRALPNKQGNEMVIMTVEPEELTFIHMSGNVSLADLSKLSQMGSRRGPAPPNPPTPPSPPTPHP